MPTIIGSPVAIQAEGLTGASVTVPADAQAAVFLLGVDINSNGQQIASYSLTGASTNTIRAQQVTVSGTFEPAAMVATSHGLTSGSQTLTFSLTGGTASQGPHGFLVFIKDINTADYYRDAAAGNTAAATAIVLTPASSTTDLVLATHFRYQAVPAAPSGWTSIGTIGPSLSRGSRLLQADSPGASTTTLTTTDNNYSSAAVISIKGTAADTTAPVLSSPVGTTTGTTTATVGATTDEGNGTLYVVVTTSATQPTVAQIKAGQDNAGAAAAYASSQTVSSTGAKTFSATGLAASTTYTAHLVHTDAATNDSNRVSSSTFTTSAANAAPSWTATPANMSSKRGQALTPQNVSGMVTDADTLTFSLTGAPAGVTINSSSGIISGTPTAAPGAYTVTVGANDGVNATVQSSSFTVTVVQAVLDLSAFDFGGFVGAAVTSLSRDGGVSYRAQVYDVAGTLGTAITTTTAANLSASGVMGNIGHDSLSFGTVYEVVATRQTDNMKSAPFRVTAS